MSTRRASPSFHHDHRGRAVGVILPVDSEDSALHAPEAVDATAAWAEFLRAGRRLERRFAPGASGVRFLSGMRRLMTAKRRPARPSRAKRRVALRYTVDASVFVNAFNPHEEGHVARR